MLMQTIVLDESYWLNERAFVPRR